MADPQTFASPDDFYAGGTSQAPGSQTFSNLDDFYASGSAPPKPPPLSGGAWDTIFTGIGRVGEFGAKVMNAMGYGAESGWGSEPIGLSPETRKSLSNAGILSQYDTEHQTFLKSAGEVLLRPQVALMDSAIETGAAAFDVAGRAFSSVTGAVAAGGQEAARQIEGEHPGVVRKVLAAPFGAAGELAGGAQEGAFLGTAEMHAFEEGGAATSAFARYDALRRAPVVDQVNIARSAGVIGEGEAGFFGAEPITPENIQARAAAAQDAGIEPPPPPPPAPDIHELARRIDPDTFGQFDALAVERAGLRDQIAQMKAERLASPEVQEAQSAVDTILGKVNNVEARLTNAARGRLEQAYGRLDAAINADTPEMWAARQRMMEADYAMRDLAVQVSDAYRHAAEMMPEPEATAVPQAEAEREQEVAREHGAAAAVGASEEGNAEVAPPSVTGEEKLGEGVSEAPQPLGASLAARPAGAAEDAATGAAGESGGAELKPIEATGEQRPRRVTQRTEENAIAAGLTDVQEDVPTYARLKDEDQARIVVETMDKDYERAIRVALGEEEPPAGATPEAFLIGVEKRAIAEGDYDTFNRLRGTKLAEAGTTMGQRISAYRTRMESSPLEAIQEVQQARQAASQVDISTATRQVKAEVKAEVKAQARRAPIKVDKLQSFIDGIICGE